MPSQEARVRIHDFRRLLGRGLLLSLEVGYLWMSLYIAGAWPGYHALNPLAAAGLCLGVVANGAAVVSVFLRLQKAYPAPGLYRVPVCWQVCADILTSVLLFTMWAWEVKFGSFYVFLLDFGDGQMVQATGPGLQTPPKGLKEVTLVMPTLFAVCHLAAMVVYFIPICYTRMPHHGGLCWV